MGERKEVPEGSGDTCLCRERLRAQGLPLGHFLHTVPRQTKLQITHAIQELGIKSYIL